MINETILSEAVLFIALFASMSIISYFVSRKNAKIYELEHPLQERKDTLRKRELVDNNLNSSIIKIKGKDAVLLDLSKKLEKKRINKEEFKMLKEYLYLSSHL